jgi:hypothetical protein
VLTSHFLINPGGALVVRVDETRLNIGETNAPPEQDLSPPQNWQNSTLYRYFSNI